MHKDIGYDYQCKAFKVQIIAFTPHN
jgi:hypothetical protein